MKSAVIAAAVVSVLAVGQSASAEEPKFEVQANFAMGGPLGLAFSGVDGGHTSLPVSINFDARLRLPRWSPLGLEVNTNISGLGFVILCDIIKAGKWRFHVGDPGLTWVFGRPMSAARYERSLDITFGAGVEWRVHRLVSLTLDWRVFLPAPWKLWNDLGVFARPILEESLKGGQLWLGISRVW